MDSAVLRSISIQRYCSTCDTAMQGEGREKERYGAGFSPGLTAWQSGRRASWKPPPESGGSRREPHSIYEPAHWKHRPEKKKPPPDTVTVSHFLKSRRAPRPLVQEYFRSRISITSAMAPSRAWQTNVAPDSRTAAEALAGANPSAAAESMERSLASSPAQ